MAISTIDQTGLNAPLTLTSPVLTTPNLGTPSAVNLANAVFPAGCVLQVVQGTSSSQFATTSSSFVSAGLSATITPKFSNSKILVILTTAGCMYGPSSASNGNYQIQRNGTFVAGSNLSTGGYVYFSSSGEINLPITFTALDSPATTSATTYALYVNAVSGYIYAQSNNVVGFIQLLEIAG